MRKLYKGIVSKRGCLFVLGILLTMTSCNKPRFDVIGDLDQNNPSAKHRKVLIIGISGVRGDAVMKADVPHINQMLNNSIYSFDALTEAPTLESPGWSSMLTGVWSAKHGVVTNSYTGNKFDKYPMFFKHIKEFNPDLKTIAISSTTSINTNLVTNADVLSSFEKDDISVKNSAVTALTDTTSDVIFVNFNAVNTAGTQYGFDPSIPEYMQAIATADGYVGELTAAIDARTSIKNEDWLVIISTDHGGTLTGTGGNEYESRNIFTVFYNKKFNKNNIAKSQTNTTFLKIDQSVGLQYAYSDSVLYKFDRYPKFSFEMRVRMDGNMSSDPSFVSNKDWGSGGNKGWGLFVSGQKWKFNVGDGISANRKDINPPAAMPALNDGKWHHIAVTVDKSGFAKTYQDGVYYAQINVSAVTTWDSTFPTTLAIFEDGTAKARTTWSYRLKGNFTDVRLWNTVLDDATIASYAKCDTTITPDHPYYENLLGWWKGNDGKGTILKDNSLRNSNLKIVGATKWEETGKNLCGAVIQADVPKVVDIATQVYSWLRIPLKPEWNLDGKAWVNN